MIFCNRIISISEKNFCLIFIKQNQSRNVWIAFMCLIRVSHTNASWNDRGRPRPWRSKLPSELQDDWWQIEAREASRGPGPRLRRTSNQYQRAGAGHVPRVLVSRKLSERCASPGMRPTDPNLLTRDREACSQSLSLRHWSRSRARGLLEILWFAGNFSRERCGCLRLHAWHSNCSTNRVAGTQNSLSQIESKL